MCAPGGARAQGGEAPPYRFYGGPPEGETAELPLELLVLNDAGRTVELTLAVDGPLDVEAAEDTTPAEARVGLTVVPGELTLGPGAYARVRVQPGASGTPAEGTYLVALFSVDGPVVRTEIQLPDPESEAAATEPPELELEKWSLHVTRWVPGIQWYSEGAGSYLPVQEASSLGKEGEPAVLGYVSSGRSAARISWTGETRELASGLAGARLAVDGIESFAGLYEGTLPLEPELALQVRVRDFFLWPVLFLALGILIAQWAEHAVSVRRPVWRARARNEQLAIDFAVAQQEFRRRAGGASPGFDIAAAVAALRAKVTADLDQIVKEGPKSAAGQSRFTAAIETLETLEATVAAWPLFGDGLEALTSARTALDQARPEPPPGYTQEDLAVRRQADDLLRPAELELATLDQRRKHVAAATASVLRWLELEERVRNQLRLAEALEDGVAEEKRETLRQALDGLYAAWGALWRSRSAEELTLRAAELDASRALFDQLGRPPRPSRALLEAAGRERAAPRRVLPRSLDLELDLEEVRRRRDRYLALRTRYAWVLSGLAFVLAVFTGLNQLYVDKEFATLWHYLNAVAWGAGTKLTLDAVVEGVGRLPVIARVFRA